MVAFWWLSGLGSSGERTVFLTYRPSPMEEGSSGGGGSFLISFPVAAIKYPGKTQLKGAKVYLGWQFQGTVHPHELEAADHTASTVGNQQEMSAVSAAFPVLCCLELQPVES